MVGIQEVEIKKEENNDVRRPRIGGGGVSTLF